MKKAMLSLTTLLLCFVLGACAGSPPTTPATSPEVTTTSPASTATPDPERYVGPGYSVERPARVSGTGYSVGVSPGWVDDTIQRQAKKDPIDLYLKTDGGKADAIVVYRYDVAGEVSVAFSAYITRQWEDLGATVTPEGFEDIDGEESAVLWREGGPDPNGKYLSYAVCSDVACYLVVIFTNLDYQAAHAQVGRPFLDTWAWDEPTA